MGLFGSSRESAMAVGKNKRLSKGKKGKGKKIIDPFQKKEWYDIKAPSMFSVRAVGKTMVTRSTGTKLASDALKGRVVEVSLADLQNNEDDGYRKMRLEVEDVQGMNCTTDKLRSLVRKWQTLIECTTDVKTTDGYVVRMFCIGFTKKRQNQVKKTCYAQTSQIRQIRKKMSDVMTQEASTCDLKDLVLKFIPEVIGKEIEKGCSGIFPLQNVYLRKVKVIKAPKFDVSKLMDLHGDVTASEETGAKVAAAKAQDAAAAAN